MSFRFLQKSDLDWDISWKSKFAEESEANCFSGEVHFHFVPLLSFYSLTSLSSESLGIGHHLGAKSCIQDSVLKAPFPASRALLASGPHLLLPQRPTLYPSSPCEHGVSLSLVGPAEKQRQGDALVATKLSPTGLTLSWLVYICFSVLLSHSLFQLPLLTIQLWVFAVYSCGLGMVAG